MKGSGWQDGGRLVEEDILAERDRLAGSGQACRREQTGRKGAGWQEGGRLAERRQADSRGAGWKEGAG
jgi:hypothetical protein